MTLLLAGTIALSGAGAALAEQGRQPDHERPELLKIRTYDTQYGLLSTSTIFGYPVRGAIAFVTDGERNTSDEGYGPRGKKNE